MDATVETWLGLPRAELDRIFTAAPLSAMPQGAFEGTLIVTVPGLSRVIAFAVRMLVWRGKVFDRVAPDEGTVINRVTPFAVAAVPGVVYVEASRLDGGESLVIDYSKTSLIARHIRDELREVRPGLFMGKVWWRSLRVCDFALVASVVPDPR